MWKMTHDMGHMTCNWTGEVNLLSEFQLPISYVLVVKVISTYFHNENPRKRFWLTKKACTKKSTLAITKPPAAASPNLLELLWQLKLLGVVDRWLVTGDKQQVTHGTWHVSHDHFFFFEKQNVWIFWHLFYYRHKPRDLVSPVWVIFSHDNLIKSVIVKFF